MHERTSAAVGRTIAALLLFGVSFGFVEAAIVDYLRVLYEPARQRAYPGRDFGDLFPLLTREQLKNAGPLEAELLNVEVAREVATMAMLAAVALAVSRNAGQWLAAFVVAFGIWDLAFYASLKVLLDWPASLFTWDILFLVPVPWAAPVLAPVLVSSSMIGCGLIYEWRDARGQPPRLSPIHWLGLVFAALVLVLSFAWDWRNVDSGGLPRPFEWAMFAVGEAIGLLTFAHALVAPAHSYRSEASGSTEAVRRAGG